MTFSIKINERSLKRLQARFRTAPARVYGAIRESVKKDASDWKREMNKRTKGATRVDGLGRRTGDLARSISATTKGTSPNINSITMRLVSAGVPYAPVQEFGKVITPKRAKALTIPLDDNLTPGGDVRYPSAGALRAQNSPSQRSFLLRIGSNAFIVLKRRDDPDLKFLWILKKSVTIPGPTTGAPSRLGFHDTWKKQAPKRRRRMRKALALALRPGTRNSA